MNKKAIIITAAVIAVAALAAGIRYYITYKKPNVKEENVLLIYRDSPYEAVLDTLEQSGAIRNIRSLHRAAEKRELDRHFEPGRYVLTPGMSNQYIIRMIANGWETPGKVTLRGYIKTLEGLASFFGKNFEADSSEFAAVLLDTELIDSLGFRPETFIGMFIPDTYEFYWTTSPEKVVRRFKKEYDRFWDGERDRLAAGIGMDRNEVTTLASIVIGETNNEQEMPLIAGVYMNRLKRGMRLQACPTVIYAHLKTEPGLRRLLNRHLEIDSPYNTYKVRGLPPGPIAVPTVTAIDAVLNYTKSNYLYFCAKPEFDGTHNFASTYREHKANSRAYNRAFEEREASRSASNAA
ncbi:MAG TPA: endolytic transglycosylase MltG [Candidatus Coprenecus stercoravium]|uniref:Endolytic murein transglycosylase n=1 Tax=Candidatus Coprenecus stercoravium TaxID=2840735 RepID=A0A9D2GQV2_9BACT|nr:endolytic transglycosylase MltG [Candidatus Coprenecus stercoravium]